MTALIAVAVFSHTPLFPKHLIVSIAPALVTVMVRVDISPGDEARTLRTLFDVDRNGLIDKLEADKISRYIADRATRALTVSLNRRHVSFVEQHIHIDGAQGPAKGAETIRVALALISAPIRNRFGRNQLRVGDAGYDRSRDVPIVFNVALAASTRSPLQNRISARGQALDFEYDARTHGD